MTRVALLPSYKVKTPNGLVHEAFKHTYDRWLGCGRATYDTSVVPDSEVVTCLGCIAGRSHAT